MHNYLRLRQLTVFFHYLSRKSIFFDSHERFKSKANGAKKSLSIRSTKQLIAEYINRGA